MTCTHPPLKPTDGSLHCLHRYIRIPANQPFHPPFLTWRKGTLFPSHFTLPDE